MHDMPNALSLTFDGAPLTFVRFEGSPVVVARELGAALGYADPGRLPEMVRAEWAGDFTEGEDYHLLTGDRLADFKRADSPRIAGGVDRRAPSVLALTESGLWMVALKTDKDLGRRFRRFLVREVIPKLARGETVGGKSTDAPRLREMRHAIRLLPKNDPRRARMVDEYTAVLGHPPEPVAALPGPSTPRDGVAAFVETYCKRGPKEAATARDLYDAYVKAGGLQSPKGFGVALAALGFRPRASNRDARVWCGVALTNDPHETAVLEHAKSGRCTIEAIRKATGCPHDNRTIGAWLRRAGYCPVRTRRDYTYFDEWRPVTA